MSRYYKPTLEEAAELAGRLGIPHPLIHISVENFLFHAMPSLLDRVEALEGKVGEPLDSTQNNPPVEGLEHYTRVSFGTSPELFVDTGLDFDSEAEVTISHPGCEDISTWLNKEQAEKLIAHLQKVFNLN